MEIDFIKIKGKEWTDTMIQEVLVVEGKMDVAAINKAVEADCIITGGFTLKFRRNGGLAWLTNGCRTERNPKSRRR